MVEALTLLAIALLVLGVVGSVIPLLPGPALSLVGVYLYWWTTDYAEPVLPVLAGLTALGALALLAEYFSGAAAARAGGASWLTSALAAVVGVVLFFATGTGPLGLVFGVAGTVFAVEFARSADAERSLRAAAYTTIGLLGSTLIQLLLTATMLVAVLLVAFV
ncbi:DUF456 domain-containing protein [Halobacteriales archaeon QS_4_69_34]|nr:MAG: DUF456 domain-containing protein [Halobacteriales archaeon QS_4_69_34]